MITRYKEGIAIEALVQDGFYLAELRVDFLADFVAQSWVDAVQTAELIVMQQEKRRAAGDEPTNKLQQVREWPRRRAYCILHSLSSKDHQYGTEQQYDGKENMCKVILFR